MIDDLFDRDYQAGRMALNQGISAALARFAVAFGNAFRVLNRIEYSSPWTVARKGARCN